MKKLIMLFFVLTSYLGAQTVSGYFTESTKGWSKEFSQDGYIYGVTALVAAGDSAYTISSRPFGSSATLMRNAFKYNPSSLTTKIMVGIQIDTAFADVEATLVTQISFDGTNWYTLETLDADTTPDVTGVQLYIATFTDVYAPYIRLQFNAGGLTVTTAGDIKFLYAIPAN